MSGPQCRGCRGAGSGGPRPVTPFTFLQTLSLPYSLCGAGLSKPYFSHVCSRGVFVNFYTENVNKGNVSETWSPAQGVGAAQTWTLVFQLTPTDSGSQSGRMGLSRCKLALSALLLGRALWGMSLVLQPSWSWGALPGLCPATLCQAMWWRSKTQDMS